MSKGNKNARITEENRQEAARLRAIWEKIKPQMSQAVFGETYNIGSPGAVYQFLKGITPLSMKSAIGFAEGLGCEISDFSPRLAREAQMIGRAVQAHQVVPPDQMEQSGNATHVFGKDNELTEKAEIETLKAQARAEIAEAQAEIARREAETAKMQARAEIAEAKLEMLKGLEHDFQLARDLLRRTEARLTETEKVLNEMQDEMISIKKNSQKAA